MEEVHARQLQQLVPGDVVHQAKLALHKLRVRLGAVRLVGEPAQNVQVALALGRLLHLPDPSLGLISWTGPLLQGSVERKLQLLGLPHLSRLPHLPRILELRHEVVVAPPVVSAAGVLLPRPSKMLRGPVLDHARREHRIVHAGGLRCRRRRGRRCRARPPRSGAAAKAAQQAFEC